ncbi:MAG TPA: biotin/lipoyl-containing protein [Thermoplasmata archaeon]|nr:biotin/lipoyl-containing protein [Thermoplasmata archaeon]
MRVVLERDGRKEEVDVAPDLSRVTVGGRDYAVTVVAALANRVELEIDGEKVVVENWPEHFPAPFGPVDVNGERWALRIETGPAETAPSLPPSVPRPSATPVTSPPSTGPSAVPSSLEGTPVVPSMPGRVIELRVNEGDTVVKGQTLLVIEAMKMRGEVTSPTDGVVRDIRVTAGTNARAKEPMMWIRPVGTKK